MAVLVVAADVEAVEGIADVAALAAALTETAVTTDIEVGVAIARP